VTSATIETPAPLAAASPAPAARARYLELDGLRGLAAVAVMLFHYELYVGHHWQASIWTPFSYGSLGVQLFFMISGFVILLTASRVASVGAFALSRFARLYPAYWTACGLIFALRWLDDPASAPLVTDALLNLPMIEIAGVPRLDNVFWTLQQEVWFYLAIAGLIAVKRVRWAIWLLAAVVLTSLVGLRFTRWFGLFLVGMVLFDSLNGWRPRHFALLGLVAADVLGRSLLRRTQGVEGWEYPLGVLVCGGLVFAATRQRLAWLATPVLLFLGTISYSLYLVHATLGGIVISRLHEAGWGVGAAVGTAIAGSLVVATALSFGIERPAMRWIRGRGKLA
jgi:peptidoglycan/LPS O-acetylase OafA/YrhL